MSNAAPILPNTPTLPDGSIEPHVLRLSVYRAMAIRLIETYPDAFGPCCLHLMEHWQCLVNDVMARHPDLNRESVTKFVRWRARRDDYLSLTLAGTPRRSLSGSVTGIASINAEYCARDRKEQRQRVRDLITSGLLRPSKFAYKKWSMQWYYDGTPPPWPQPAEAPSPLSGKTEEQRAFKREARKAERRAKAGSSRVPSPSPSARTPVPIAEQIARQARLLVGSGAE